MNIKVGYACFLLVILCFSQAHAYRGRKRTENTQAKISTSREPKIQKSDARPSSFMAHLKQKFMGTSDRLRPTRSQRTHMAQVQAELKKSQPI